MKILRGLMLKHVYILLILDFPLSMQAAIFPYQWRNSIYSDFLFSLNIMFENFKNRLQDIIFTSLLIFLLVKHIVSEEFCILYYLYG